MFWTILPWILILLIWAGLFYAIATKARRDRAAGRPTEATVRLGSAAIWVISGLGAGLGAAMAMREGRQATPAPETAGAATDGAVTVGLGGAWLGIAVGVAVILVVVAAVIALRARDQQR